MSMRVESPTWRAPLLFAVAVSVAAGVVAIPQPSWRPDVARSWLAAVMLAGAWASIRVLQRRFPPAPARQLFARRRRPSPTAASYGAARRLSDLITLATLSRYDYERSLRPILHQIAADRLALGHGLDVDDARDQPRVRAVLGEGAWLLLQPSSQGTPQLGEPGPERRQLLDLIERLEQV
jgi:hypothetical protein